MIHVIDVEDEVDRDLDGDPSVVARYWPETDSGLESLRVAAAAIRGTRKPLHFETQIRWGDVDDVLLRESKVAMMVCVGSAGISPMCHEILGSTAARIADEAHCPVAVIRRPPTAPTQEPDWIVAVVDDTSSSDVVICCALEEARLRRAPVLVLGVPRMGHDELHCEDLERRAGTWRHDHPYVHIYPVPIQTTAATFLAEHDELSVQLTVLGAADAGQTPAIVGPCQPHGTMHRTSSVLVVR
jgi:nucleotide-binding universal stress UspA family protein